MKEGFSDENQATFWNPEMVLSPEYYQSILDSSITEGHTCGGRKAN